MRRRFGAFILTTVMVSTLLGGCASGTTVQKTVSGKSGTDQSKEETTSASKYQTTYGSKKFNNVTITVELFDRSNAPEGSTITDNRWTKYVNQEMNKVGINVEFVPVPRSDEVTKMQAMMASGTSPDITVTYTYAYAQQYYDQGGIWDLSEFVDGDDQAKNLKKYLGNDVMDIGRNKDKSLYGIVARRATTAKSNLFIRKDWLDEFGLAIPTTPDELHDCISKMVKENPEGKSNVIGLTELQAWNLKMAFSQLLSDPVEYEISGGDSATGDYYDKGMREYYRYMNKMYNEGLMDQEYYDKSEDDFKSDIVNGKQAFMEYNVNGSVDVLRGSLMKTLQENDPKAEIVSIPALKNVNDGKQYSAGYAEGGLICMCPKTADAEKVEACMTYLDWLSTTDGGYVLYHGLEGEHYKLTDNIPVVIDSDYNSKDKDWIRTDLFLVGNQGYFNTVDEFNECTSKEAPGYEQYVIDNYQNALTGTVINDSTYTAPSASDLQTDVDLVRDEYRVKVVTCSEADFDATYDEYMSQLEGVGIKTLIDERTAHAKGTD